MKMYFALAAMGAGGSWMSGAVGPGTLVDLPQDQVIAKLSTLSVPEEVRSEMAQEFGYTLDRVTDGDTIRWKIMADGRELSVVEGKAASTWVGKTRMSFTAYEGKDEPQTPIEKAISTPLLRGAAAAILEKQAGALVEGRPLDEKQIGLAVRNYVIAHPGQLLEQKAALDAAQGDIEKLGNQHRGDPYLSRNAYSEDVRADAAERKWHEQQAQRDAARPMTDLSEYR